MRMCLYAAVYAITLFRSEGKCKRTLLSLQERRVQRLLGFLLFRPNSTKIKLCWSRDRRWILKTIAQKLVVQKLLA